jgi:hypothetical protein
MSCSKESERAYAKRVRAGTVKRDWRSSKGNQISSSVLRWADNVDIAPGGGRECTIAGCGTKISELLAEASASITEIICCGEIPMDVVCFTIVVPAGIMITCGPSSTVGNDAPLSRSSGVGSS